MVPFLAGFVALGVDVGAARVLQMKTGTAADAAALAIASDCLAGDCGDPQTTAAHYAAANDTNGDVRVVLDPTSATVRVTIVRPIQLMLAPLVGLASSEVTGMSSASWSSGHVRLVS